MSGRLLFEAAGADGVARVVLAHPAKHNAMLACDVPLLAQIDGACIGGGVEIAACCDIRVCGAARINKQTLRQLAAGGPTPQERRAHFTYAPHAAHVEGIAAFIEKRAPRFHPD